MKKLLLSALAFALLLAPSQAVWAQEKPAEGAQPVLTVSFSGYEEIRSDLEWLGKLGNNPQLAEMVELLLMQQLEVQEFAGLDKARPWGLIIETEAQEFRGYGFLPVTDLAAFLKTLEGQIGEPTDAGEGVQEITIDGQPVYVKGANGWAFISTEKKALAQVPEDPAKLLDGLHETYDLAVRANVKNIPPMVRQMLLAPIQMGLQMGMERRPGETDEEYDLRVKMARQASEQISAVVNDLDTILVGIAIDQKKEIGVLEYVVTAVEGSKLAEQMAQAGEQKTQFAGFLRPDAAISLVTASELAESDVAQAKLAIKTRRADAIAELEKQGLGEEELNLATRLINDLADVIEKTVEQKRLDGGAVVFLGADRLTAVAGTRVAETAKLEQLLKDLTAQAAKDQPELAAAIKLNAEEFQGYRFHRITLPTEQLGDDAAEMEKFVGETLEVILAVDEESAYVAAGRDAAATLKEVIATSKAEAGKVIPPMKLVVSGTPVAQFAAAVAEDEDAAARAEQIVDLLKTVPGKDQVIVTSTPVPNGSQVRIEIQQGILKLLGALPTMAQ